MSYSKTEWKSGDLITSEKLNNIENGIADADKFPPTTAENNHQLLGVDESGDYALIDAKYPYVAEQLVIRVTEDIMETYIPAVIELEPDVEYTFKIVDADHPDGQTFTQTTERFHDITWIVRIEDASGEGPNYEYSISYDSSSHSNSFFSGKYVYDPLLDDWTEILNPVSIYRVAVAKLPPKYVLPDIQNEDTGKVLGVVEGLDGTAEYGLATVPQPPIVIVWQGGVPAGDLPDYYEGMNIILIGAGYGQPDGGTGHLTAVEISPTIQQMGDLGFVNGTQARFVSFNIGDKSQEMRVYTITRKGDSPITGSMCTVVLELE